MAPREVKAGESFTWSWEGKVYENNDGQCFSAPGKQHGCVDESCALAGEYKLEFTYRSQPVPMSDGGFGPPDCLANAGLEGVAIEAPVVRAQVFTFPEDAVVELTFP
jgi:hypothetical protein